MMKSSNNRPLAAVQLSIIVIFALATASRISAQTNAPDTNGFSFIVAGDMRNYLEPLAGGKHQFDGACAAIRQAGPGEFMVLPGDFDPPDSVRSMLDRHLGTNYFCYYVVGDHEAQAPANMDWFRRWGRTEIPHLVRRGPPGAETTIYAFDFANSHFVALSDYFDGQTDAAKPGICDAEIAWLEQDLIANHQPLVWVICHKPIECLPDMDSGRLRHAGDSLITDPARRARFVALLKQLCRSGKIV